MRRESSMMTRRELFRGAATVAGGAALKQFAAAELDVDYVAAFNELYRVVHSTRVLPARSAR